MTEMGSDTLMMLSDIEDYLNSHPIEEYTSALPSSPTPLA